MRNVNATAREGLGTRLVTLAFILVCRLDNVSYIPSDQVVPTAWPTGSLIPWKQGLILVISSAN